MPIKGLSRLPYAAIEDPLTAPQEGPDDMSAHIKAALLPVSVSVTVREGRMVLGTWQGIYLFEHRTRGRQRQIAAHLAVDRN